MNRVSASQDFSATRRNQGALDSPIEEKNVNATWMNCAQSERKESTTTPEGHVPSEGCGILTTGDEASTFMITNQMNLDAPPSRCCPPAAQSLLRETLDALTYCRGWNVVSTLSMKGDSGVFVVTQPAPLPQHCVIRLSPYTDDHAAAEFCDFFYDKNCPQLPQMEESQIVCVCEDDVENGDFILEEYEFVHDGNDPSAPSDFLSVLNHENTCPSMIRKYVADVVRAVDFMSGFQWCHGDISIENIVCGSGHAKLIDFESCMHYELEMAYPTIGFGPTKVLYRPPELDFQDSLFYPEHVDVWSIGVILFVAVSGKFPFSSDMETRGIEFEFLRRNGFKTFLREYHPDVPLQPLFLDLLHHIFVVFESVDVGEGFF